MPNGTYGGVRGQVNTKIGDKHPMISVYLLLDLCLHNKKLADLLFSLYIKSNLILI